MADALTDCSAVIVNYNGGRDLLDCLASLQQQRDVHLEVIVVDNASTDGSLERAQSSYPWFRAVKSDTNQGFAGGANCGALSASGRFLLFLNPDVVLEENCVALLCQTLEAHPGVAGPRLIIEASGTTEYGAVLDLLCFPVGLQSPGRPLYVQGCVLATSRRTFELVGGFDSRYFMIYEDADYCWRVLLAGQEISSAPLATAVHRGGAATPGGYIRGGRREVSAFRIPLFERNRLATILKCAPFGWRALAIAGGVSSTLVWATWAAAVGRHALAKDLIGGLIWNARELPATLRARALGNRRVPRWEAVQGRVRPSIHVISTIWRYGAPKFVKE